MLELEFFSLLFPVVVELFSVLFPVAVELFSVLFPVVVVVVVVLFESFSSPSLARKNTSPLLRVLFFGCLTFSIFFTVVTDFGLVSLLKLIGDVTSFLVLSFTGFAVETGCLASLKFIGNVTSFSVSSFTGFTVEVEWFVAGNPSISASKLFISKSPPRSANRIRRVIVS